MMKSVKEKQKNPIFFYANIENSGGEFMLKRIAIIADNSLNYLEKILELWNTGYVPALIDFRIPIQGCIALIDQAEIKAIYTDKEELYQYIREYRQDLEINLLESNKMLLNRVPEDIKKQYKKRYDETEALILFSSGTTGKSKGIILTHKAITVNADLIVEVKHAGSKSRLYIYKTFAHCATFVGELIVGIIAGAEIYISSVKQIMKKNILNINKYGITHFSVNPTVLQMIIKYNKKNYSFPTLELVVCSGSLFTSSCRASAQDFFGCPVINMYGMTEVTALAVCQEPIIKDYQSVTTHPESVGKPLRGIRLKILDNMGKEVEVGSIGNIFISTPTIMCGYIGLGRVELDKDGYWDTGDVGYFDQSNELYIIGRRDRMLITSGHNVYPESIERLIKVSELVNDCYVGGVDDSVYGKRIACVYSCDENKKEAVKKDIQNLCLENLASYEVPYYYIWKKEFNYTSSGKLIIENVDVYSILENKSL